MAFTSEDRVRDVIHNFSADGFDSPYPKYKGGRPPTFTLPQRREIKKIAKSRPAERGLPFSAWSLTKPADHTSHREQGSMIRRYLAWRNRHTAGPDLRRVVDRANVA